MSDLDFWLLIVAGVSLIASGAGMGYFRRLALHYAEQLLAQKEAALLYADMVKKTRDGFLEQIDQHQKAVVKETEEHARTRAKLVDALAALRIIWRDLHPGRVLSSECGIAEMLGDCRHSIDKMRRPPAAETLLSFGAARSFTEDETAAARQALVEAAMKIETLRAQLAAMCQMRPVGVSADVYRLIELERRRGIRKGFDADHDDMHGQAELMVLAVAVLAGTAEAVPPHYRQIHPWVMERATYILNKYTDLSRRYVVAMAVLVAEYERCIRQARRGEPVAYPVFDQAMWRDLATPVWSRTDGKVWPESVHPGMATGLFERQSEDRLSRPATEVEVTVGEVTPEDVAAALGGKLEQLDATTEPPVAEVQQMDTDCDLAAARLDDGPSLTERVQAEETAPPSTEEPPEGPVIGEGQSLEFRNGQSVLTVSSAPEELGELGRGRRAGISGTIHGYFGVMEDGTPVWRVQHNADRTIAFYMATELMATEPRDL